MKKYTNQLKLQSLNHYFISLNSNPVFLHFIYTMDFKNKVVLITGASTGIGKQIALRLAAENCTLALIARRIDLLKELETEIKNSGSNVFSFKCDVSSRQEVEQVYSSIIEQLGNIDVAILNAGVSNRADIEEFTSEKAEETFGVNTLALVYFIDQLLPGFKLKNKGVIVGISSVADLRGYPKSGFYNASKAATTVLLQSLRNDLKKYNIKVITVRPGFVKTPMTDKNEFYMPLMMNADKAANIIVNGIKKEKRIIQFPLPIVFFDYLLKMLPAPLIEWLVSRPLPARKDKARKE